MGEATLKPIQEDTRRTGALGNLEAGTLGRRCIKSAKIPTTLNSESRTMIHKSTAI